MGRKKRKRNMRGQFVLAEQGRIPWTVEEYMTVLSERKRLDETPHDDWDRQERGLLLHNREAGIVQKILFNPDVVEKQIAYFIRERYNGQPHHVIMAHLMRYFAMNEFFRTNQPRLTEEGLIKSDPDRVEGLVHVSEAILEELATAPYEESYLSDGREFWRYDRERIIERALARKQREDEAEGKMP
jgi:hypothetical protein